MFRYLLLPLGLMSAAPATPPDAPAKDARALHDRLLTLDTHIDTPMQFVRPGWDFGAKHDHATDLAQVDLGRMDEGVLDGGFFVIYTPKGPLTAEGYAKAKDFAFKRLDLIEATLARFPDRIALATRPQDARRIDLAGKRFAYLSIENSYPLGTNLSLLAEFHRRGVRMAGPVHNGDNQFADAASGSDGTWKGLSPLGRQWVAKMNRLGMVIDVSHASDVAFDQILMLSKAPVIASHSGSKALWNHPRNLDDDRIRRLAKAGGAICANSVFIGKRDNRPQRDALDARMRRTAEMTPDQQRALAIDTRAVDATWTYDETFEKYVAQLLHLIDVAGVDHVCFGADWDGGSMVKDMHDISALPRVTERLRAAGYSEGDLQKMWSGNVLRILAAAEAKRTVR